MRRFPDKGHKEPLLADNQRLCHTAESVQTPPEIVPTRFLTCSPMRVGAFPPSNRPWQEGHSSRLTHGENIPHDNPNSHAHRDSYDDGIGAWPWSITHHDTSATVERDY